MDTGMLQQVLTWVAFSGGAGVITYLLWEQLEKWFKKLAELPSDIEGYVTLALTGVFAVLAYVAQIYLGYVEMPVGTVAWIEAIFAVFGAAIGVTRLIHGIKKMNMRKNCCGKCC